METLNLLIIALPSGANIRADPSDVNVAGLKKKLVEAGGIEPPSRDGLPPASTCVAALFVPAVRDSGRLDPLTADPVMFRLSYPGARFGYPACVAGPEPAGEVPGGGCFN